MAEFSSEQIEQLANSLNKQREATDDLTKIEKEAEAQVKKNVAALKEFQSYMKNFGAVMTSADRGTAKYGSVVTGATDAMGNLLMKLGPLGIAAGLLAKAFGGLAAASLKQNEALVKSYRSLSEIGAIDSSGVEGLLANLYKVGATSEDLDNFQRVVKSIAPDLAIMGGTVAKGMNSISNMTQTILDDRTLTRSLKNFGYTTEQIMETGSRYVATQARNGSMQGKSNSDLAKSAGDYMKVLAELTMITGASRDEGQKALEEQQRDVRFRAYLAKIEDPRIRERTSTSMIALALQNKSAADTIKDQMMTNGGVTSRATAQFAGYMGDSYRQVQKLISGTGDITLGTLSIMKDNAPNLKRALDTFGDTIIYGGKDAASALGISAEEYDTLQRLQNTNVDEFRKQVEAIAKKQDGRLATQSKLEEKEIQNAQAMDKLKFIVGNGVVPAMDGLVTVVNRVGSALATFTQFITFGAVDLTDMFKSFNTMGDVTKEINKENAIQVKLNEEINELKERDLDNQKHIDDLEQLKSSGKKYDDRELTRRLGYREKYAKGLSSAEAELSMSRSKESRAQQAGQTINSNVPTTKSETESDPLKGLTVKKGDVQKPGAHVDKKLIELMNNVQKSVPGFNYISSVNDQFHQTRNSKHKEGTAFDFTLGKWPTKEEGANIAKMIQELSPNQKVKVIDEYNNPSSGSTGGHMHTELLGAKTGGIFNGPNKGYPVMLHGKEAVLPMKNLDNLITKQQLTGSTSSAPSKSVGDSIMENMMALLSDKLDQMINYQRATVSASEKILRHAKI